MEIRSLRKSLNNISRLFSNIVYFKISTACKAFFGSSNFQYFCYIVVSNGHECVHPAGLVVQIIY